MEENVKKDDIYIYIKQPLCCIPEINTTLQINYISIIILNSKVKKKK